MNNVNAFTFSIFPTTIIFYQNLISEKENEKIINASLKLKEKYKESGNKWLGEMYSTTNHSNIVYDSDFTILNNAVENCVKDFLNEHGSNYEYKLSEGWVNIGYENSYQEFHFHPFHTISCCYYATFPEGSGEIIFAHPVTDMLPIKGIKENNKLVHDTYSIIPSPRTLIVWRSYLKHMVKAGKNIDPRISVAYNL